MREQRPNRLALMLSNGEVEEIQEFRFAHRMDTQASAVRHLIRHGLEAIKAKGPAATAIAPSQEHDQPR